MAFQELNQKPTGSYPEALTPSSPADWHGRFGRSSPHFSCQHPARTWRKERKISEFLLNGPTHGYWIYRWTSLVCGSCGCCLCFFRKKEKNIRSVGNPGGFFLFSVIKQKMKITHRFFWFSPPFEKHGNIRWVATNQPHLASTAKHCGFTGGWKKAPLFPLLEPFFLPIPTLIF